MSNHFNTLGLRQRHPANLGAARCASFSASWRLAWSCQGGSDPACPNEVTGWPGNPLEPPGNLDIDLAGTSRNFEELRCSNNNTPIWSDKLEHFLNGNRGDPGCAPYEKSLPGDPWVSRSHEVMSLLTLHTASKGPPKSHMRVGCAAHLVASAWGVRIRLICWMWPYGWWS